MLKPCQQCGDEFAATHGNQRHCGAECRERAWAYRPRVQPTKACELCGASVVGARRRWCDGCREEGDRREARDYGRGKSAARTCSACGLEFWRRGRGTRCKPCGAAARATRESGPRRFRRVTRTRHYRLVKHRPAVRLFVAGDCPVCGSAFVALASTGARFCSAPCQKKAERQIRKARRRARIGVGGEVVNPQKVFERDGWTCRLCSKPVEREARVPAHLAPTVDHILPLALGGAHGYVNVQCAHFICNSRKSANVTQSAWAA